MRKWGVKQLFVYVLGLKSTMVFRYVGAVHLEKSMELDDDL